MKFQRNKIISSIVFAVIASLLFAYAVKATLGFPRWLVDDAFILFRYAENLVEHGELNWNPGENPTEGYTGIAQILLIAAGMRLGISPADATHAIGIAAFFIGGVLIILTLGGFNLGSVTSLALYFMVPFVYAHVWSGLETMLYSMSILFAIYAFARRRNRLFVAALLLVSLARPEGALLALTLLALYRPFSLRLALWYLVPGAIYFIWRAAYYGQLLPNTFYAKALAGDSPKENFRMIREFFTTFLPIPALMALIFLRWNKVKEHGRLVIGVGAFSLATLYLYLSSHLAMNFVFRFMVPLYVIAALAVGAVMAGASLSIRSAAITLVLIASWIMPFLHDKSFGDYEWYCRTHYQMLEDEHIQLGKYINENLPPDEWLTVYDAGAIPYHAKRKAIDLGGLNDEYLARARPKIPELVDYFYSHDAGALVFTSRNVRFLKHGDEARAIHKDPRFNNYTLARTYQSGARSDYFQFLYVRNDLLERMGFDQAKEVDVRADDTPGAGETRRETGAPEDIWERAQSAKDPHTSIQLYRRFLKEHPDHDHVPYALFMIGFTYSDKLDQKNEAEIAFKELLERYPDHEMAESAEWMLKSLDKPAPAFDTIR